ncbi:MAG TPA: TIGR03067 domain-containing protein [Gemmataceae bacterium]|nr:TIGR03067 domain-containing protein [Gemmataceae bacterium]
MAMRISFGLVVALVCASIVLPPAAAQKKGEAAARDQDAIQGTWKFVSVEMDGKKEDPKEQIIIFQGDKFTVKIGDMVLQAGTQKLDPGKKPATVDAIVTEGEGKGTTMLGIYEIQGDTLKSCFDMQGKKRPTEFKTAPDSGTFLAVLKRAEKK